MTCPPSGRDFTETGLHDPRWREAEEMIAANGMTFKTRTGYESKSAALVVSDHCMKELAKLQCLMGLNPVARAKNKINKPERPKTSKWEGLLAFNDED
jgi:P27 family predicted phage terminase small subunit